MQRRTPEVTYTFEGEPGKYVLLDDYTHDVKIWVREVETAQSALASREKRVKELEAALKKVKPIVGAACAGASNEMRPLREAAYKQLCAALEGKP